MGLLDELEDASGRFSHGDTSCPKHLRRESFRGPDPRRKRAGLSLPASAARGRRDADVDDLLCGMTFDDIDVPGSPSQGKAKGVASSASKGSAIPSTLKLTKSAPSPPGHEAQGVPGSGDGTCARKAASGAGGGGVGCPGQTGAVAGDVRPSDRHGPSTTTEVAASASADHPIDDGVHARKSGVTTELATPAEQHSPVSCRPPLGTTLAPTTPTAPPCPDSAVPGIATDSPGTCEDVDMLDLADAVQPQAPLTAPHPTQGQAQGLSPTAVPSKQPPAAKGPAPLAPAVGATSEQALQGCATLRSEPPPASQAPAPLPAIAPVSPAPSGPRPPAPAPFRGPPSLGRFQSASLRSFRQPLRLQGTGLGLPKLSTGLPAVAAADRPDHAPTGGSRAGTMAPMGAPAPPADSHMASARAQHLPDGTCEGRSMTLTPAKGPLLAPPVQIGPQPCLHDTAPPAAASKDADGPGSVHRTRPADAAVAPPGLQQSPTNHRGPLLGGAHCSVVDVDMGEAQGPASGEQHVPPSSEPQLPATGEGELCVAPSVPPAATETSPRPPRATATGASMAAEPARTDGVCGGNHDAVTALPGQGVATKVDGVAQVDSGGRDLETAFTSPALPSRDFCIQGAESIRVMAMAREQATALEGQLADCALQAQLLRAGVFEMRNPFTIARLAASRKRALALLSA